MGAWGSGILENDGAQDAMAEICDELFSRVIELIKHPRSHEYDDEPIAELFVRIEMIIAMSDRDMINSSPDPNELRDLSKSYLKRWADYFRECGHTPTNEELKNMQAAFNALIKIAGGSVTGSLVHRLGLITKKSRS